MLEGFKKGINLGGWLSQGKLTKEHLDTFITEEDIERIKEMGCDHLRLPVDFENIYDEKEKKEREIGYHYIDLCLQWCKKHGLNVVLDLHKAPGYSFDDKNYSSSFFENEELKELFLDIWDKLSKKYAAYQDMMMFEMLNEVTDYSYLESWNELALRCIQVIRKNCPTVKILYGGVGYSSIKTVKWNAKATDKNIVYNIHCYEPMAFTHQGAYWMEKMPLKFKISYPMPDKEYRKIASICPSVTNGTLGTTEEAIKLLKKQNFFIDLFKEAVDYAKENGVELYCGEYGVIDRADLVSTLVWMMQINEAFEHYQIGRALWSYKKMDFGLIDDHYADIYDEMVRYL